MVRVYSLTKPGLNDRYLSDKIYGISFNQPAYRLGHVTDLMPLTGEVSVDRSVNASQYDHALEDVHPWHHNVYLEDDNIEADWTTTERAALYRFKFGSQKKNKIVIKSYRNSSLHVESENSIKGWEEHNEGAKQYFYATFNKKFDSFGTLNEEGIQEKSDSVAGRDIGVFVAYNSLEQPVEVRVGISYISTDQAKENLENETSGKSFEQIIRESKRIWENTLGKIKVEGGTEKQKRIFYTCLYRAYERMVNISESGKYYSGYDKKVHADTARPFYVDDWLWDSFRCHHPLRMILNPEQEADMIQSYVKMYEQEGWMPGFPQFYGDFSAMIGFHSAALVWDAWQKGIRNFDIEKAYNGLYKNAMKATMLPWRVGPMCALDSFYHKKGWYPAIAENEIEPEPMVDGFEKRQAVALTLEHSYDDWCLAQLARELNRLDDYYYFEQRSQNYRNVFNQETGFMAPKSKDGSWIENFDPQLSGGIGSRMYFAENNSWIWSFNVLHDIDGLIQLMGGNDAFSNRLDELYNEPTHIAKWQFIGQFPDASGLNGMFPAGNEPAFHVPYLYNYAGKPWKTQRRIWELMDMWFDDSPLGLAGDEDGGALCSWYIFSAMGFYPVTPGSGLYAIGSPFFEAITISLPNGEKFKIRAKNCSKRNKYIQSAKLNGKAFDCAWISHSEIMNGGILEFEMGDRPNKKWASDPNRYIQKIREGNKTNNANKKSDR